MKRLVKGSLKAMRRFCVETSGIAAIEFIMVAPVMFLLLGVILESGFMFFFESSLQAAVDKAARVVRTGSAQMNNLSAAQFKDKICDVMSAMGNCTGSITVRVQSAANFATLNASIPSLINVGPATGGATTAAAACYNPGAAAQPAVVIATYDWYFVGIGMKPFANLGGGNARRLMGITVFQNEPFVGGNAGTPC